MTPPRRRDRRGRGARGVLVPQRIEVGTTVLAVPSWRSRSDRFASLVQQELRALAPRWADRLDGLSVQIHDVPPSLDGPQEGFVHSLEGGGVPLARALPDLLVLYRGPLELRAEDPDHLCALVHEVVVEGLALLLGLDADEIDPPQG